MGTFVAQMNLSSLKTNKHYLIFRRPRSFEDARCQKEREANGLGKMSFKKSKGLLSSIFIATV